MSEGKYDLSLSCNKCAGDNTLHDKYFDDSVMCECKTKCNDCGFEDVWSYGFYMSSDSMKSNCKKYG